MHTREKWVGNEKLPAPPDSSVKQRKNKVVSLGAVYAFFHSHSWKFLPKNGVWKRGKEGAGENLPTIMHYQVVGEVAVLCMCVLCVSGWRDCKSCGMQMWTQ